MNLYHIYDFIRNSLDCEHNENGPATIQYYNNGNKRHESYMIDGLHHRIDGMASIFYDKNGNVTNQSHYRLDLFESSFSKKEMEELENIENDQQFFKFIKRMNLK